MTRGTLTLAAAGAVPIIVARAIRRGANTSERANTCIGIPREEPRPRFNETLASPRSSELKSPRALCCVFTPSDESRAFTSFVLTHFLLHLPICTRGLLNLYTQDLFSNFNSREKYWSSECCRVVKSLNFWQKFESFWLIFRILRI